MTHIRPTQIAGHPDEPSDLAVHPEGALRAEAPARRMVRVEVEFELIGDDPARQDGFVLGLVTLGEDHRKQFRGALADDLLALLPPESPHEGLVGVPVASGPILHEKHDIRESVEQTLEIRERNLLQGHGRDYAGIGLGSADSKQAFPPRTR